MEPPSNFQLEIGHLLEVIGDVTSGLAAISTGTADGAAAASGGTSTLFTNGDVGDSTATILITEGFANAWKTGSQESHGATGLLAPGTQIELTFSDVPDGVTLTLSAGDVDGDVAATFSNTTITDSSGDQDSTITLNATDIDDVDAFEVDITVTVDTNVTSLDATPITVVANFNPIGDALDSDDVPQDTDGYPVFDDATSNSITVVSIGSAVTNLLIPYLVSDSAFDTGIALANTTMDPWSGNGGATAGSGVVSAYFYPRSADGGVGDAIASVTTSSTVTPGIGLSDDGTLAAGATWTVTLTELLDAAGEDSDVFAGYIFMEANFLLAHGISFIYDATGGPFVSFSPMLTMDSTQIDQRDDFESLGF